MDFLPTILLSFGLACAQSGTSGAPAPPAAPLEASQSASTSPEQDALAEAFDQLVTTLREVETDLRESPSFGSEAEQVGAYRHILRSVAKGMEAEILQDADYPYFRILDFWLREGGDNPDQRYAFTPIRGGETYRIWGELGSAARLEFQIYAGRPWDGSGSSAGYLAFEEIVLEDDGSFEVWVSPERHDGNWLSNPPNGTTLFARHIYSEWNDDRTGDIHIDRVGFEGKRRPPESAEELAARISAAAVMFGTTARTWPAFLAKRYVEAGPANTVSAPYDTYALGGAKGRWMSGGYFDLPPDQALLLRMPKTAAQYQAVQLTDMWLASLEHGNQVSSLNSSQSILAPDGAYYYVIGPKDPGYANWIDSGALVRGVFLLRWDGMLGQLPADHFPTAELVELDELESRIPAFSRVTEEERETVRMERRRHLQLRSHR
jgi:hypothetical protein